MQRIQFRLRSIMFVVTVLAIGLAYYTNNRPISTSLSLIAGIIEQQELQRIIAIDKVDLLGKSDGHFLIITTSELKSLRESPAFSVLTSRENTTSANSPFIRPIAYSRFMDGIWHGGSIGGKICCYDFGRSIFVDSELDVSHRASPCCESAGLSGPTPAMFLHFREARYEGCVPDGGLVLVKQLDSQHYYLLMLHLKPVAKTVNSAPGATYRKPSSNSVPVLPRLITRTKNQTVWASLLSDRF
jgi:hypothetical protein